MIFTALTEAAKNNELIVIDGGLCRFHLRRDKVVVIRELIVLPEYRRNGKGTRIIKEIIKRYPNKRLLAKCPSGETSNLFWQAFGFSLVSFTRVLNIWEYRA